MVVEVVTGIKQEPQAALVAVGLVLRPEGVGPVVLVIPHQQLPLKVLLVAQANITVPLQRMVAEAAVALMVLLVAMLPTHKVALVVREP